MTPFRIPTFTTALLIFISTVMSAQENSGIASIISKIHDLEKEKDPKCYATANRLEDFMYGTPLSEDARNLKIEIQKELIYHLRKGGHSNASKDKTNAIERRHILPIIEALSDYKKTGSGDYLYTLTTGTIKIKAIDYDQYTSVSYAYRSLLSVEQDLFLFSEDKLLSFSPDALELVNSYVNIMTLVTLKVADLKARKANLSSISKNSLKDSWIAVLEQSKSKETLNDLSYMKTDKAVSSKIGDTNRLVKEIIEQKVNSYEKYNQLNASVFLRNIQVYFAKQRWPKDKKVSDELRSYYLESLILFSNELIKQADAIAAKKNKAIIRVADLQEALSAFLPSTINTFEDVTFFPNSTKDKVTIESYDLDAFRDSGFHWNILDYAISDLQLDKIKNIDPNAAELLVEGIAQMGVLVLRLAGDHSHSKLKTVLDTQDINQAFLSIQELINNYNYNASKIEEASLFSSSLNITVDKPFTIINKKTGLNFTHKSSDWLSRLIRGYTTSSSENLIKLAIPPAFGGSGVACEDINNDGLIDVLLLGGFGNKLLLNTDKGVFKDISEVSNINNWNEALNSFGEPRQPIIADFNNDGQQDIFITYVNMQHKLYKNIDGVHFEDVSTDSNLGGTQAVAGPATTFDYNNDGLLDIFIGYFGNYVKGDLPTLSRDNQNGMPNKLFKNLGDFKFVEVDFTKNQTTNSGWTQAIGHSDINQDGLQDIIVGNDFGKNKYYFNNPDGLFTEVSEQLQTDKPSYTMNVGITDLNGDLYPDFYISNIVVMQKDEKYVSPNQDTQMKFDPNKMATIRTVEANDLFISNVEGDNLEMYQLSSKIGSGYSSTGWSWDADFFDYDNDGDEDLYCLNGMNDFSVYSTENPFYYNADANSSPVTYAKSNRERNVFFVNEGNALINKAEVLGLDLNSNARSASYLDYDNDGDLDIIINNYHDQATMLENNGTKTNNWIKIKLIGNQNANINRDAIGSTIILNSENLKNIWREIHSTTGYLSVHPKIQHFGLGNDTKTTITVKWSNGEEYTFTINEVNASYEISYPNQLQKVVKS